MAKLLLLFTVVPLGELYLLLKLHELIGLWATIGIVLCTGTMGAWLARTEGLRVLKQWQRSVVRGKVPEEGVLGGVLILVGGVLLVTPGVVTDLLGFLLLIPPTRRVVAEGIRRRLEAKMQDGTVQVISYSNSAYSSAPEQSFRTASYAPSNVVMDVEGELLDDDDDEEEEEPSEPRRVLH